MELSHDNAEALVHRISDASAENLAAFVRWLNRYHYSASYVHVVARHALAFGRWCEDRGNSLSAVGDDDLDRYQRHRSRRRSRCLDTLRQERTALGLLMRFLCAEGICPTASAKAAPVDDMAEGFVRHLLCDRGLAAITVERYANTARRFLTGRFGEDEVRLRDLCQTDCIAFVQSEAKHMRPAALKTVVVALRSFLRYAQFRGEISAGLAAGVPAIAGRASTPAIPKAIATEHAQRAIGSCDHRTAVGRRDRAVLLLLARLALRACEIVRLTLDDIDWDRAQLRVRGKGGRESLLPLPPDVGEAIAAYLEHGRPVSEDRHLFLRSLAPIRGFMEGSDGIGTIVRSALKRAKVDAPHRGSHQFRHALAVRLLRLGASLPEIGEVLRHRSPQSTSIYAQVDLCALRTLTVPWPGGAR